MKFKKTGKFLSILSMCVILGPAINAGSEQSKSHSEQTITIKSKHLALINKGLFNNTLEVLGIIDRSAMSSPKVSGLFKEYSEAKNGVSKNESYKNLVLASIIYLSVESYNSGLEILSLLGISNNLLKVEILSDIENEAKKVKEVIKGKTKSGSLSSVESNSCKKTTEPFTPSSISSKSNFSVEEPTNDKFPIISENFDVKEKNSEKLNSQKQNENPTLNSTIQEKFSENLGERVVLYTEIRDKLRDELGRIDREIEYFKKSIKKLVKINEELGPMVQSL
ncbi:MAG: hypothetical protein RsTaC01_1013 [Candidatus Paraimprobicoccus trichonymphae]|uniref:Uncharacterized protein n=1 Tax=Candidatus Paraimprobicoccus trichonymphae TaxID=3033793 RepID=A0AA48KZN3_9FIRM|nr:MAG: hypothetical protein RsTaC01_1013 [Candidatus Paraimprobicoccus trichonymphae]